MRVHARQNATYIRLRAQSVRVLVTGPAVSDECAATRCSVNTTVRGFDARVWHAITYGTNDAPATSGKFQG